jgi:peptide/nickel transport system permease protein
LFLRLLGRIALTVLAGGFLAATLVRYAPGFAADEEQWSIHRSSESVERVKAERMKDSNVVLFYARSMRNFLHGDFGVSRSLNRPVRDLLKERSMPTLIAVATGLAGAWSAGLLLTVFLRLRGGGLAEPVIQTSHALLQCFPAAVIALLLVALGGHGPFLAGIAIALVLFPRVFSYSQGILAQAYRSSHILMARAKGLSPLRVLLWHAAPVSFPQLVSFAGVSVSLALSAAIPMEVILDIPGIGQLAWQAALARDMGLILVLSIILSAMIGFSNTWGSR